MQVRVKRGANEVDNLRRNLTKTALARLAGLHRTHLSDLLAGRAAPGPRTRQRLLDALGGGFDDYFEIVRERDRTADEERIGRLLASRYAGSGGEPAGARARLLRMREALSAGLALPPEDRVWLDLEWKAERAELRRSAAVRSR